MKECVAKNDAKCVENGFKTTTADNSNKKTSSDYKMQIRWFMVIMFIQFHITGIYGWYLIYFKTTWFTFWYSKFFYCRNETSSKILIEFNYFFCVCPFTSACDDVLHGLWGDSRCSQVKCQSNKLYFLILTLDEK